MTTIKTTIINKTPHEVIVSEVKIGTDGLPFRLNQRTTGDGYLLFGDKKINITKTEYTGQEDLPPYSYGTYYIVSAVFCQANPDRADFLIVNETIRDERGVIIGCKSLSINPFLRKDVEVKQ